MTDEQKIEWLEAWAATFISTGHRMSPSMNQAEKCLAASKRLRELARFESEWRLVPDEKGGHMFNKANGSKWYPEPTDARTALGEKA